MSNNCKIVPSEDKSILKRKQSLYMRTSRSTINRQAIFHLRTEDYIKSKKKKSLFYFVIHPASKFRRYWDLITATLIIFYIWVIPIGLSFYWWKIPIALSVTQLLADLWFFFDLLLNFRTGYIKYGVVSLDLNDIAKNYLKSPWFIIDMTATIPWDLFISSFSLRPSTIQSLNILQYLKLPKLLRFGRLIKGYSPYFRYKGLFKIVICFFISVHLIACVWTRALDPCNSKKLLSDPKIQELYVSMCSNKYLSQIYWYAIHIGVTALFGTSSIFMEDKMNIYSFKNKNWYPNGNILFLSNLISLYGIIFVSILFGNFVFIIQSWNRSSNLFRKKMDYVYHEMDYLRLSKNIRGRLKSYYDYLYINNVVGSSNSRILNDPTMSRTLKRQVAVFAYHDLVAKVPLFSHASDEVLGSLCLAIRQEIYLPTDYIFREGEMGKELFIINKGIIEILPPEDKIDNTKYSSVRLNDGSFFGELGILMNSPRSRTAQAVTLCDLCVLRQNHFLEILGDFPEFAKNIKNLALARSNDLFEKGSEERQLYISRLNEIMDNALGKNDSLENDTDKTYSKPNSEKAIEKLQNDISLILTKMNEINEKITLLSNKDNLTINE